MAIKKQNTSNLGYLGVDFQYRFVKSLMEDKNLFRDLRSIIDQNTFTDPLLKVYVGVMKDYYDRNDIFPSYEMMGISLNKLAKNDTDRKIYEELNQKIYKTSCEGGKDIKELGIQFFRQQNIVKTANEILKIASSGDTSKYEKCVELLTEALAKGASYDLGYQIFDELADTLDEDYREAIPTGMSKLDEYLNGGLGKGELGIIAGSSGFGKAQPLTSNILTPNGFVEMGDINVGDDVIGDDGMPHKVIGVYPQGERLIYEVYFSNKAKCECDFNHLWTVYDEVERKYITCELKDIIKKLKDRNNNYRFSIPNHSIIHFNENNEITDPFLYGCNLKSNENIETSILINSLKNRFLFLIGFLLNHDLNSFVYNKITALQLQFLFRSFGMDAIILPNLVDNYSVQIVSNKKRYITSVKYKGIELAQCIMLDYSKHLYITNDFIVTHNTTSTTYMTSYAATFKSPKNTNCGYKCLQIVFEDGAKAIKRKHISHLTQIEACDLSKKEFIDEVKERIYSNSEQYNLLQNNIRILTLPTGEISVLKLKDIIKKLINSGFRPDLVILDYFECLDMGASINGENEFNREGKIMRKLENMAKEFNFALWVAMQGTKDSSTQEVLTVDKIGGSAKKVQIAHVIVTISRTLSDIKNNKATISLMKNRAGQAGIIWQNVYFNNGTCTINMDDIDEGEDLFDYKKSKDKEEIDLQTEIFKKLQDVNSN